MARSQLRSEQIALDGIIRGVGRFETRPEAEDPEGFRWQAARARLRGQLPHGVSYLVQADLLPVRFLDAWAQWSAGKGFQVRLGHFRPVVSREMITPLERLPFLTRSEVSNQIAPKWDLGLGVGGDLGPLRWDLGVFEGGIIEHRQALPLGAAHLGLRFGDTREFRFDIGVAATQDREEPWASTSFSGQRIHGSISADWSTPHVWFGGEVQLGYFDPLVARDDFPVGGHLTARVRPTKYGDLSARVEAWSRTATPGLAYQGVVGGNLWPFPDDDPPVELTANYRFPLHRNTWGDHSAELALMLWL